MILKKQLALFIGICFLSGLSHIETSSAAEGDSFVEPLSEDLNFEFDDESFSEGDDEAFFEEELGEVFETETNDQEEPYLENDEDELFTEEIREDIESLPAATEPTLNPKTKMVSTKKGDYIYHPNQEKGLYKITRQNEYLYEYDKSDLNGFIHLKAGQVNFENFPVGDATTTFEDLYDSSSLTTLYIEYEWQPFKKRRSLSVKVGGGLSYARGKGRFVTNTGPNAGELSDESYTFMMFPLSAGLVYKFKFKDDQLFMPFVSGGIDYNLATEFRSGFEDFKYNGILATQVSGGVLLNLGWLEKSAALELDKEFGINNTYLSIEARQIVSLYNDRDISGMVIVAGLSFEY